MYDLKCNEGLAPYSHQAKWGFIDRSGKPVIKAIYDDVSLFSEGLAACIKVVNAVKCLGFINKMGEEAISFKFDDTNLSKFKNGVAIVYIGGVKRYIDKAGEIIEELANYIPVTNFSPEGIAKAKYGNKEDVIINKKGEWMNPDSHMDPEDYAEGIYLGHYGIFHQNYNRFYKLENKRIVHPFDHPVFQRITLFSDGIAGAKEKDKNMLRINKQGQTVGRELPEWTSFGNISNGWIPVNNYTSNLTNYIGSQSDDYLLDKHLTSHDFWLHTFCDEMSRIQLNKNYTPYPQVLGYFNTQGQKVIDKKFDSGEDFSEGFACVKINEENIYIDKQGKELFKFK